MWKKLQKGSHYFLDHPRTKYQGSRHCGFRQEDFFHIFPIISTCKTYDPRGRAIPL